MIAPQILAPRIIAQRNIASRLLLPKKIAPCMITLGLLLPDNYPKDNCSLAISPWQLPQMKIVFWMICCLHNCPSDKWPWEKLPLPLPPPNICFRFIAFTIFDKTARFALSRASTVWLLHSKWYGMWSETNCPVTLNSIFRFLATLSIVRASIFSYNNAAATSELQVTVTAAPSILYVSTIRFVICWLSS